MEESELAKFIDHTNLKPTARVEDIEKLCAEAREFGFASVCVNPCNVRLAAELLKGSSVAVCSVVGFPLGQNEPFVIRLEALRAIDDGAGELDFVINVGRLKAAAAIGDEEDLQLMMREWRAIVKDVKARLATVVTKLIIECCYLTDGEKRAACLLAKDAGFDFVKTSTGFGSGGAKVADVALMREAVGAAMGVKAAGGIRTRDDALAMIAAGATRLGCSAGKSLCGER